MKSVKNPTRKMYIVAGLQPAEDTTGGAWFDDGKLDSELIELVALWVEKYVSDRSWLVVRSADTQDTTSPDTKSKGKRKTSHIDDDEPRSLSPEVNHKQPKPRHRSPPKTYAPHPPDYRDYPTADSIAKAIFTENVVAMRLPPTAVVQLLDVMVYDEKLYTLERSARSDEPGRNLETNTITMYRCFRTPADFDTQMAMSQRTGDTSSTVRRAARRHFEIEDLGRGGASEVPCLRCPAFDLCGDGGPVNVVTCPYFDEWYLGTARADRERGEPWAASEEFLKVGEKKKSLRIEALRHPPQPLVTTDGSALTIK
jgi:DNA-directed RNA polymerase III subunit RPC6